MERLTYFDVHYGRWAIRINGVQYSGYPFIDRLAAYEDTGLEPEQVELIELALMGEAVAEVKEFEGISIERLQELAQAEKDGRLVVLPCKTGDILWTYYNYPQKAVYSFKVTGVSTLDRKTVLNTDILHVIPASDVGKTVFLTRAEAEAALTAKGEQDETD